MEFAKYFTKTGDRSYKCNIQVKVKNEEDQEVEKQCGQSVITSRESLWNLKRHVYKKHEHILRKHVRAKPAKANKCQVKWRTTRNTFAKQRQSEAQRRASWEPALPTWKCCQHIKFLAPFLKEGSVALHRKGRAGRKSPESGELSEEKLHGADDWMTPLDSEIEEDDIKRERSVGGVNGDSKSVKKSEAAAIVHDTGEEENHPVDTEDNASFPSSLSSPLPLPPPAAPVFRRPGLKRGRLTDNIGNAGGRYGRGFVGDAEADEMFFFSLLPYFRRLSYKKRSALKIQILQVVYEAVFE